MRLLHICSYYHGRPQLYSNLFSSMEELEAIDNEMYAPIYFGAPMDEIVPVQKIMLSPCYAKWDRVFFHLKHGRILKDIQQKIDFSKYDLMHSHTLFSNGYIALRMYQKTNIPYTVTVQSTDIFVFFKKMPFLRKMGLEILRNASAVFFHNPAHRDYMLEKYISQEERASLLEKTYVIPIGIDRFWLENIPSPRKLSDKRKFSVIYAGEINKNKNITMLAKAVERLRTDGIDVDLAVVGNIVQKKEAKRLLKFPFVTMLPRIPKEKLVEQYRSHDIFALVSRRETFGLVCAEAMSQGLPVIYTRGQGFDRQFEDGKIGFSADCNSAKEIADAILNAVDNYNELSEHCINLCGKFDWGQIAEEYQKIFLSISQPDGE